MEQQASPAAQGADLAAMCTRPFEVVSVAGDDDVRAALLGTADSTEQWERLLEHSQDLSGLRFIDHTTEISPADDIFPAPVATSSCTRFGEHQVGVSVGLAVRPTPAGVSRLLREADTAMYAANAARRLGSR